MLKGSYAIGKLANAVGSKRWYVYLFDPFRTPSEINPDTRIIARGRLEFAQSVRGSDYCAALRIPAHYLIRGACVVVAP